MTFQAVGKRVKNEKGLTLIELLAVIVILGIIAAIAIPAIGNIIQKSKVDAVKSEAIQVLNGAKMYVSSNGISDTGEETLTVSTAGTGNLDPFVDDVKHDYTVKVSADGDGKVTYKITSTKLEVGKASITFTGATIDGINKNKDSKGDITIKD